MAKRHKLSKSSLHWFIRSRPYLLVADLRRRFDLDETDDVTAIQLQGGRAYIGLPQRAGRLLEDLARENRVGMELAPDLQVRTVIGVYAYDLLRQQTGLVRSPQRMDEAPPEPPDEDGEEAAPGDPVAAGARPGRPPGPAALRAEGRTLEDRGPEGRGPNWRGERRGPPRASGAEREERPDERSRRGAGPPGRRFPGQRGPGRPSGAGQPNRPESPSGPERPEGRPPRTGGPGRGGGQPGRGQSRGDRSGVP